MTNYILFFPKQFFPGGQGVRELLRLPPKEDRYPP